MSDTDKPKQTLVAGADILGAVLRPHGYKFRLENEGKGSGGYFASGSFRKDDRRLELHFRYSLGLVTYHIGNCSLDHEKYMRCLGVYGHNQYPDFPAEPMESFHHLTEDLQNYCSDFVAGDGRQFQALAASFREDPERFKGIH